MKPSRLIAPVAVLVALTPVVSACTAGQQVTAADIIQKMRDSMKTTTSLQTTVDLSLTINKDGLRTLVQGLIPSLMQSGALNGMMSGSGAGMLPGGMMGGNGSGMMEGADGPGKMGDLLSGDLFAKLPDSVTATINYWEQSPDKARVEIATTSIPGASGAKVVYDGQKLYALDAANNTVYTVTPGKHMDQMPDNMKGMKGMMGAMGSATVTPADVEKEIDKIISAADVKLVGSEKVAGVDTYKLEVAAKPDAMELLGVPEQYKTTVGLLVKDAKETLWVDKDRWVPLKLTLEHPQMGTFTYSATKLERNTAIDASTFVLQVPAGAKTVDLDAMMTNVGPKTTTLPDAKAAAQKEGWTLLEPSYMPSGATLVGVSQMQSPMMSGFMLSYSSSAADFTIMESKTGIEKGLGDDFSGINGSGTGAMKDVTVRGVQAKAFSPDGSGWTSLIWQEKGSGVWVAIRGKLSLDETLKIAEGLK